MKQRENNKNVFDEIDRDTEQVKTAMKRSRLKRILKIKMLKGLIIFLFILSASFISFGIYDDLNIADISMGIICLISAVHCLIFFKIISKSQTKKGEKR